MVHSAWTESIDALSTGVTNEELSPEHAMRDIAKSAEDVRLTLLNSQVAVLHGRGVAVFSSANTTSNSSSTLRLQAAGVAPAQKGVAPLDEKKGVSLQRRPHKERAAGAAGAAALESYELTIDRKDGPEALARQLGESLRGTAVAKALPKLIKALGSMRTEGPMATATWGLLGAFVQVLSFMPEPADGVAAPGELVNAAAEALAEEFAVKLKGNVQPQLPPPPLLAKTRKVPPSIKTHFLSI